MTKIEWVQNQDGTKGETWNPVTGCTKVSAGCKNCYAERMARRLAGRAGYPEYPNHFGVTLRPDRLEQPLRWKKPRKIFVCSMSDLFHKDVPLEFILEVFDVIRKSPRHTFQILTKRADAMNAALSSGLPDPLPNVWLGTSVENQEQASERIPHLLSTPASVRFLSCEPLLGEIDFNACSAWHPHYNNMYLDGMHWVIVGGESGPGARPMNLDWARIVVGQCREASVPVFVKQLGGHPNKHADMFYWPADLRAREYPNE